VPLGALCAPRKTRRLTLPSSGPAYGGPLKSNVRALVLNWVCFRFAAVRRVSVHELARIHAPVAHRSFSSRGFGQHRGHSLVALLGAAFGLARPEGNPLAACASSSLAAVCLSAARSFFLFSVGPNLKYEFEVQYNAGPGLQASRARAAAELSLTPIGCVTHRRPNPSFKRTCQGLRPCLAA
jgi:hypothetical protein